MGSRPNLTRPINHQPTSSEAREWKLFAQHAADVALGRRRDLRALKDKAMGTRSLRMFGPEGQGNVCVRLREIATEYAEGSAPDRLVDELARLADEVLKRCIGHEQISRAERDV